MTDLIVPACEYEGDHRYRKVISKSRRLVQYIYNALNVLIARVSLSGDLSDWSATRFTAIRWSLRHAALPDNRVEILSSTVCCRVMQRVLSEIASDNHSFITENI